MFTNGTMHHEALSNYNAYVAAVAIGLVISTTFNPTGLRPDESHTE
jgi:hypothetical protein